MDRTLQVREILAARGLTLHRISERSAELFGRSSPFYIPHNWYSALARNVSIPTIHQVLAMSHITNFQMPHWLAVFGFELDLIWALQLQMARHYTTLLDPTFHDTTAWIPWLTDRSRYDPVPSIAPLGRLLARTDPKRAADVLALSKRRFHYAVIGGGDTYAIPYFLPGSVVRVDPEKVAAALVGYTQGRDGPFFLVTHGLRSSCSRLVQTGKEHVVLYSPQRPYAEREVHIGKEATIVGVIDSEIRLLDRGRVSRYLTARTATFGRPQIALQPNERDSLSSLLRLARMRAGLSFRAASSLSREIANTLSDELYFTAPSTLSDYEALTDPPRHIQKILTLCLLYCLSFEQFLRVSGLPLEKTGQQPMPDAILRRQPVAKHHGQAVAAGNLVNQPQGLLASLLDQWEEVPLFLRSSLDEITNLKDFSVSDLFWVGGERSQPHPLLMNATFVVVNRRARKPHSVDEERLCEQPFYLVLRRDGSYLCGRCSLEKDNLTVHGYPRSRAGDQQFKNGSDAEVVGEVTAILRRLL